MKSSQSCQWRRVASGFATQPSIIADLAVRRGQHFAPVWADDLFAVRVRKASLSAGSPSVRWPVRKCAILAWGHRRIEGGAQALGQGRMRRSGVPSRVR